MAPVGSTPLESAVAELIQRHGPIPFSRVMDLALYDTDHGFYASGGSAGRRGDFITSPEVGPLFGTVVARALDSWWTELGEPDPFVFIEAGAGVGTLAIAVLAARPQCAPALRYVTVERSAALRARQAEHLALVESSTALGIPGGHDGPVVASLADMPAAGFVGVVFANELLDNIPFDLVTRTADGWVETRVGLSTAGSSLELQHVAAGEALVDQANRTVPELAPGTLVPVFDNAASWVRDAVAGLEGGRVVVIDYATSTTADLAARGSEGWLRTFRGHERLGHPLIELGSADITADVALDQIVAVAGPIASTLTQAEFLRAHGIDQLVDEGRQLWEAGATTGDLAALKARSRVREAEALLDPDGLGGFLVAQWLV